MPVVLVVDDQPFIGVAFKGLLAADPEIRLHLCHDPREAKTPAARLQPAVILIDLVMPDVDGLTLIGLLRGDPGTSRIPLIAMSGNTDDRTRQEALAAGASDFFVKLPSRQELIATIHRHAAAGPAGDGLARVAEVTVAPAESQSPQSAQDQTLDRQAVAALRDMGGAITRLFDLGVQPFLVAASVIGILGQRLVRGPVRRVPSIGRRRTRRSRDSEAGRTCRRMPGGGREPGASGATGPARAGASRFTVLDVTDEIRSLIASRATEQTIKMTARRAGMRTLLEDAIEKAAQGLTTL